MSPSLLVAADEVDESAAWLAGLRVRHWPDDVPTLVDDRWAMLAPLLDAVTGATGVRRVGADEAMALPLMPALATGLEMVDGDIAIVGEPAALTRLVTDLLSLAFAEQRLSGMPVDVLARLHPALRAVPGAAAFGRLIEALRAWPASAADPALWGAAIAPGKAGERAARVLALLGMRVGEIRGAGVDWDDGRPLELARSAGGYLLTLRVRGLRKESLRLARAGERLLVTVDGVTVPVTLPSVLRRCEIRGGRVEEHGLVIDLVPDETRWR